MQVVFEFLGKEPIENIITCMNYKMDKTVFFGYREVIAQQKKRTEAFLKEKCGVSQVVFLPLSYNDLQTILKTMRSAIERELEEGNQIFFDITGGESLMLVAFGMLSGEYDTPMHLYDVAKNELIELEEGAKNAISTEGIPQTVKLDLSGYIALKGGVINERLHKEMKDCKDTELETCYSDLWQVSKKYADYWNAFSDFIKKQFVPDERLEVRRNAREIVTALREGKGALTTPAKLNEILDDLADIGVLLHVKHENGVYQFQYLQKEIQDCLWEGGSILEMYVFQQEKEGADDCRIGVHIDWDGIIHNQPGIDVVNEIDVLVLNGNVPTFISCKSGKMGANPSLYALYELETVAERFGGKYARKILVTARGFGDVYLSRAAEMGIEVRAV